jgi:1-acyl-sn-glycerol-3-phosphate acyltransferase
VRLPPRWVRRVVLAPAVPIFTVGVLTTLPLWLLVAAAVAPLFPGKLRLLRVLWGAVVALVLESLVLVVLFGLWLVSGFGLALRTPRMQRLHYRIVGWYLRALYAEAARVVRLKVEIEGVGPDEFLDRPLLVFSRHAGPGDSFMLVHALVNWYAREPRIVLADRLQWAPALDVMLNRLPNRFIPATGGKQLEARVAELATALDHDDAFVIFPEGGNFTEGRRTAGIARLRERGLADMARRSEAMRHVLPPRPGGVGAALSAAPEADVAWVAQTGLDHLATPRDVWKALPFDATVHMRWWRVPASEVPRTEEARVEWLYGWWEEIDRWVDHKRLPRP